MEIYGWGNSGILVNNTPGKRITRFDPTRIHDNFIHHNQHPGTLGYGVEVGSPEAWADIYRNVFDFNRHAIAAEGTAGGYSAEENLVLRGGGWHGGSTPWNRHTAIFDVHGTGCWWSSDLCGDAGRAFRFYRNSFQYNTNNAIHIRGKPLEYANIYENVFPHDHLEQTVWGWVRGWFGAIRLNSHGHVDFIDRGNKIKTDTYLEYYSQGDFDGDGIDDLFLATGQTWWHSSSGQFHWTFLNTSSKRIEDLKFGYFDDDDLCDVITESRWPGGGPVRWMISSGGTGAWKPLEQVWLPQPLRGVWKPLKDVQFGRFDPNDLSRSRRTTHAFYRAPNDEWHVMKLSDVKNLSTSDPGSAWEHVGGSSFPMSELRFGDFNGDGVTDVLAVEEGHWAYSESARKTWQPLNRLLSDPVAGLFIANMDGDDNIDDILRLEVKPTGEGVDLTWLRSTNGRFSWKVFKRHSFSFPIRVRGPHGFVGRFGAESGGTLVVDTDRFGHFFSKGSAEVADREWRSSFPY